MCFTGVGGVEGDGDIFRPYNQETFIKFVHDNTDVCFAGVGGLEGDGDIFRPDNQETFIMFVHDNTDVCFAGVGGVEGDGDLDLTIRKHSSSLFMITQMYGLQVLVVLKEMEI